MLYFKCRDVVGCYSEHLYSLMNNRDTTEDEIVACLRATPASNRIATIVREGRFVARSAGESEDIPIGERWLLQSERWAVGGGIVAVTVDVANFTAFGDFGQEMYTMQVWNFVETDDGCITTGELARLEKAVINAARAYRKSALELGDCKNLPSRAEEYLAYRNRKSQEYQDARRAFYEAVDVMDGKSNTDDSGERAASSAGELARLEKAVLNAARVWANAEPCTNTSALLLNLYRAAKAMNGKSNEGNG